MYRSEDALITEGEIVFDPFESPYAPLKTDSETIKSSVEETYRDSTQLTLQEAVQELEIRYLCRALDAARHNQRKAAELLGLTYHQFRGLYRKYTAIIANADQ